MIENQQNPERVPKKGVKKTKPHIDPNAKKIKTLNKPINLTKLNFDKTAVTLSKN